MVRTIVATAGCARFGTRLSRLVMKWVRQRCQDAPGEHRGDSLLKPPVGVGGHELYAAEPPRHQRAQELEPEGAILAGAHIDAHHLTPPLSVDRRGDHHA